MDNLQKPKVLKRGDTVALITPASYVSDPDQLAWAKRLGDFYDLKIILGKNSGKRMGEYDLSVEERLEDLHSAFLNPEIKAVMAIRGGYGAMHILDKIDYEIVKNNPKIFLGFSDITALHLAFFKKSNLISFHSPVAISSFTSYTRENFAKAVFSSNPIGKLSNPPDTDNFRPRFPIRTINSGIAQGKLIGGNLSLICSLIGTEFEIDTTGKILFIEEVGEEPYRIDRMLMQLRFAGKLEKVAGIVIGDCANCQPKDFKPATALPYSLGEVFDNQLSDLNVPTFYGLKIGHTADQLTLPLGVEAKINADEGSLEILESATTE